jgi:hypothetical protein
MHDTQESKVQAVCKMKYSLLLILASACCLLLTGCEKTLEGIRSVTYPPDFNYISKTRLTNTMQQFALYTTLLDQGLRDAPNVSPEQRETAIGILQKMERLSRQLATESLSSNHDILSFNIDRFRRSIADARVALQQEPPNYYKAGTVSAYCLNCHSQRSVN